MGIETNSKLIAYVMGYLLLMLSPYTILAQENVQKESAAKPGQTYSSVKLRKAIQQRDHKAVEEQLKIYKSKRLGWTNESSRPNVEQWYKQIDKLMGAKKQENDSQAPKIAGKDYSNYLSTMMELIHNKKKLSSEEFQQQQKKIKDEFFGQQQQKLMAKNRADRQSAENEKTPEKSVQTKIERLKSLREQIRLNSQQWGWDSSIRPEVEESYYDMLTKNPVILDRTLGEYEARAKRNNELDKQIEHVRNWNPRAQINQTEQQYGTLSKASPFNLVVWCGAYSTAKNYAKITECIDEMHARIDADNRYYCLHPTFDHPDFCKSQKQALDDYMQYVLDLEATIAFDFGDYQEALSKYKERLRLRKIRFSRGNKRAQQKRYTAEREQHETSRLAIFHAFAGNIDVANSYINEVEKSTSLDEKKCKSFDSGALVEKSPMFGLLNSHCVLSRMGYMNLASIYMATNKYSEVLEMLDREKEVNKNNLKGIEARVPKATLEKYYGANPFDIQIESMRAKALFNLGRYEEAKAVYKLLLDNPGLNSWGNIYWYILYDLGRIALRDNQLDTAIGHLKNAITAIEKIRSTIDTEAGKIGFVEDKQGVYRTLIEVLMRQNRTSEAFEYVERSKARALVDLLASQKRLGRASIKGKVESSLDELTKAEIATLIRDPQVDPNKRRKRQTRASSIRQILIQQDPDLASLVTVNPASIKEIQSLLAEDETLLEYYQRDDTLVAFVVTRNELSGVNLKGKGLRRDVNFFRSTLTSSGSDQYRLLSSRLYQRLIAPLKDQIRTQRVTIVPHGVLHYLPLSALGKDDNLLIDRYAIRILQSASVMQFLRKWTGSGKKDLLVLGNPTTHQTEQELKFAEREAKDLAALQAQTTLLLKSDATETALRKQGAAHKRVHFASHAYFNPAQPLHSGVQLSRDEENDGFLTAGELYTLDLPLDLVTLSACETGLGDISAGDDVIGLTRGFIYAGARTIVASLWKVDDETTRDLMVEFYRQLKKTDKAEALRKAQRVIRERYPHPYYWAAFQLMGSRM